MFSLSNGKRMSSRLALLFVLLALVALLAACAAPAGSNSSGAQPAPQAAAATEAPKPAVATEAPPAAAAAPVATEVPAQAPAAAGGVSFSKDVMPVFEAKCIKCHGGEDGTKGDLSLKTYDDMMKGGKDGQVVAPGDSKNSPLWQLTNNGKMPRRQPKLPQEQINLIAKWVDEGAQNN